MQVITLARVSTEDQKDKGFSLPHQKSALESYCDHKGFTILRHFEEDHSAKNFNRPEWKKLLAYVKSNKRNIDALLVTRWDRFSRNTELAYRVIREFRDLGIEINAIEQPLDMSVPDAKVLLGIYLTLPEVENDKISIRTTEGMRRAKKEGCYTGKAPIGYLNHRNEEEKSTLIPDPKVAAIIQKVFNEYASGIYSTEEIRKRYYNKGLKVSKNTLLRILKSPVYCGKIAVKQYKKEDAMVVEGLHPAIVDSETFQKVQRLFRRKLVAPVHVMKEIDEILPLRGFLKCPCCSRPLTGSGSRGRNGVYHYYYHCNPPCRMRFKIDEVHKVLSSLLGEFVVQDDFRTIYKRVVNQTFKEREGDRESQLSSMKREIAKLQIRLNSIKEKYIDDLIDQITYNEQKQKTESSIEDLCAEIESIESIERDLETNIVDRVGFLQEVDTLYNEATASIKKKILTSLFPEPLTFKTNFFETPRIDKFVELILLKDREIKYLRVG